MARQNMRIKEYAFSRILGTNMGRMAGIAATDGGLISLATRRAFFEEEPCQSSSLSDFKMGVTAGDLACSSACLRVFHAFELP
jgi:hypothetical protein